MRDVRRGQQSAIGRYVERVVGARESDNFQRGGRSGSQLGPYQILDAIGAGGMGEVYRARDTRLDPTVAVKMLPAYSSTSFCSHLDPTSNWVA